MAMLEGFPRIALKGIGEIEMIVRIEFFIDGHIVPVCYRCTDLRKHKLTEDIAVTKQDIVLQILALQAANGAG
jgi:uncharacterized membrane protein